MLDSSRLEALRRRVEQDPGSIAFAQLAEEYRRAGRFQDAVAVCRAGLANHPGYLSARVTLGRTLIELQQLDEGQAELERVLDGAPENFAAIRGLAEIHHRRGELNDALIQYRAALRLAPSDPDLTETVAKLTRALAAETPAARVGSQANTLLASTEHAAIDLASEPPTVERSPVKSLSVAPEVLDPARTDAERTIVALEHWLAALHGARAPRHA